MSQQRQRNKQKGGGRPSKCWQETYRLKISKLNFEGLTEELFINISDKGVANVKLTAYPLQLGSYKIPSPIVPFEISWWKNRITKTMEFKGKAVITEVRNDFPKKSPITLLHIYFKTLPKPTWNAWGAFK